MTGGQDPPTAREPGPSTGAAGSSAEVLLGARVDALLPALADRTRRRILVRLIQQPDDAGAVARDLGLTRQGVSKHLRVLEGAQLVVDTAPDARRRVHAVDPARLREVSDLLGLVADGWDRRLSDLRDRAEAAEGTADVPPPTNPRPAAVPSARQ